MPCKREPKSPGASRLPDLFADTGPLASRKSGYGFRPEQLDFARAVEKTLKERGVLLADAPTGTGKSAAYLAPAILDAAASGGMKRHHPELVTPSPSRRASTNDRLPRVTAAGPGGEIPATGPPVVHGDAYGPRPL